MDRTLRTCWAAVLLLVTSATIARADEFKANESKPDESKADEFRLSHNHGISCSRGLAPGKLNTATCRSFTYLFNVKTSEYFRCEVGLSLTRDNKEVINVQTDGACTRRPRIFETDGNYDFDAAETMPPNTNSFFGSGGYSAWAADTKAKKVRGCITIASGLGSDVSKCLDMTFR